MPARISSTFQRRPPEISRGEFGKRCASWISGSLSFHRRIDTRQLWAPKSIAARALRSSIESISRRSHAITPQRRDFLSQRRAELPKKRFRQPPIHRYEMAGGTARLGTSEKENRR